MFEAHQVVLRAPNEQILRFTFRADLKNPIFNQDNGNHTYIHI